MAEDPRQYDEEGNVKGGYLSPEEAMEQNLPWKPRKGESSNLRDPGSHYQTPDESRQININWATQPTIASGRSPHPEMTALYNLMNQRGALGELEGFGYEGYTPKKNSQLPNFSGVMQQLFQQPNYAQGFMAPIAGQQGFNPQNWLNTIMLQGGRNASSLPPELRALLQFLPG